jgi:predicted ester cyclase
MSDAAIAPAGASIESLIDRFHAGQMPRARLIAVVSAAGASAAAAAMLANVAEHATPVAQPLAASLESHHQAAAATSLDFAKAHDQHLNDQVAGTSAPTPAARSAAVAKMMGDYSLGAVVNDPLFGGPLLGSAAIAVHKTAEMAAISDVSLKMLSRSIVGDQILATWELEGIHSGPYYTFPPTGKQIQLSGATVQTRGQDGKILVESLFYDAVDMRRQLTER